MENKREAVDTHVSKVVSECPFAYIDLLTGVGSTFFQNEIVLDGDFDMKELEAVYIKARLLAGPEWGDTMIDLDTLIDAIKLPNAGA